MRMGWTNTTAYGSLGSAPSSLHLAPMAWYPHLPVPSLPLARWTRASHGPHLAYCHVTLHVLIPGWLVAFLCHAWPSAVGWASSSAHQ